MFVDAVACGVQCVQAQEGRHTDTSGIECYLQCKGIECPFWAPARFQRLRMPSEIALRCRGVILLLRRIIVLRLKNGYRDLTPSER
jgi:hypothetical protein